MIPSISTRAKRTFCIWGFGALLLLLFGLAFIPAYHGRAPPMDEGTLLVYPEMLQRGALPYRDFETFYGPANPVLLSIIYSVFGTTIIVERSVGLFYRLLTLAAVFGIVKRWGLLAACACTFVAGCLLLTTQIVAFAWIGGVTFACTSLWVVTGSDARGRWISGGIFCGIALLFRPDLAPALLLAFVVLGCRATPRDRWLLVAGCGIALLPLALLACVVGPLPLADNLFLIPVIASSPARHLPLHTIDPTNRYLLEFHAVAVVLNIAAACIALWKGDRRRLAEVHLAMALFSAALTHEALQRADWLHVVSAAFLSIGMLPLSLSVLASRGAVDRLARRSALVASAIVVTAIALVFPLLPRFVLHSVRAAVGSARQRVPVVRNGERSFPVDSAQAAQTIGRLVSDLDAMSARGDRLFVGPGDLRRTNYCDTFIYHLLPKLVPATYYVEMNPFSANRAGSRLARDIATADWIVLDRDWDSFREENASQQFGPDEPNAVVRERFVPVQEYGGFILLRRRG